MLCCYYDTNLIGLHTFSGQEMSCTLPSLVRRLTVVDTEGEEFIDMTYTNFVSRHMVTTKLPLYRTQLSPLSRSPLKAINLYNVSWVEWTWLTSYVGTTMSGWSVENSTSCEKCLLLFFRHYGGCFFSGTFSGFSLIATQWTHSSCRRISSQGPTAVCDRTLSPFKFVWHRDSLGAITAAKDTRSL